MTRFSGIGDWVNCDTVTKEGNIEVDFGSKMEKRLCIGTINL